MNNLLTFVLRDKTKFSKKIKETLKLLILLIKK